MTYDGDLYEWACAAVDDGELAMIVVRTDGADPVIDGFTLEVNEEGQSEGVPTDELIEVAVTCHRWAAEKDSE